MQRVVEPELMQDDLQAQAYAAADFEDAHSNFIVLLQDFLGRRKINGYVLDLGCGPGDISVRFARAYPECTVHGIDGSEAMLRYGRKYLKDAGNIQQRIELIQGILPGAVLPRPSYDAVISNSLLHHLHNPQVLWKTIKRYAGPGAPVFIMDLKRPETVDQAHTLVETYAIDEPEILRSDFYNSLLAAFEVEEITAQIQEAGLDHFSVRVVSDRHVVIAGHMT